MPSFKQFWSHVNFDNPTILAKINTRSKRQADLKLDYMESFMIKLHQTGPGKGINEDEGRRVYTKQWDPLLIQLRKKMGIDAPLWLSASLLGERGRGDWFPSWMFLVNPNVWDYGWWLYKSVSLWESHSVTAEWWYVHAYRNILWFCTTIICVIPKKRISCFIKLSA